jgi:uncharacterized protein YodC (DUF2158 family)
MSQSSEFKVGDVVSLNSHPYSTELQSIIFSGEPQLVSPLMIISELIKDAKTVYNETTRELISKVGNSSCKCIWYSSKSHQFEEEWLSSKLLKKIKSVSDPMKFSEEEAKSFVGKLVKIKTADLELQKKKSSLTSKSDSELTKSVITPLLTFVAPVMQVIQVVETKRTDLKEAIYDARTGEQKRFFSDWSLKCKWFNSSSDKFSEKFLPIDALLMLEEISEEYLSQLNTAIREGKFVKNIKVILKPHKITSRNGVYYLRGFDFLNNRSLDLKIKSSSILEILDEYHTLSGPFLNPITGEHVTKEDVINKGITDNSYLRITYKKKNGEVTVRTIKNYSLKVVNVSGNDNAYLEGYCLLRKKERTFKLKRVKKLETLDFTYKTSNTTIS